MKDRRMIRIKKEEDVRKLYWSPIRLLNSILNGCNLPSLLRNEIKQCFTLLLVHFQILHRSDGATSLPWQNISCSVLFYKKGPAGQRQRLVKVCVLYEFLNQTKQSCVITSFLSFHATCCIFILFWSMTGCKKNCVFLSKIKKWWIKYYYR